MSLSVRFELLEIGESGDFGQDARPQQVFKAPDAGGNLLIPLAE